MIQAGQQAPEFSLPDQDGTSHALASHRGAWVLLYFYPKDDTPGCTTEACSIRDNWTAVSKLAHVFGVSADSIKSHKKFAEKYSLNFPLLADTDRAVINAYGVWGKKKFMGREYEGILRTSFLIKPDGSVARVYEDVKPATHVAEVLKDLQTWAKKVGE